VIDTSDDSEGTRDRPPTGEQSQAQPLNENPLLEAVPGSTSSDTTPAPVNDQAASVPATDPAASETTQNNATDNGTMPARVSRLAVPLAGVGLVAAARPWSERVDDSLAEADETDWRRLRRAGRASRWVPKLRERRKQSMILEDGSHAEQPPATAGHAASGSAGGFRRSRLRATTPSVDPEAGYPAGADDQNLWMNPNRS
jgi:hypothetical protein